MDQKKSFIRKYGWIIITIIGLIIIFGVYQVLYLRKAHSTFEKYYAFRGCQKLIERTDTHGLCQLKDGAIIKLVKYQDKWYLDGDLPWACLGRVCFGP